MILMEENIHKVLLIRIASQLHQWIKRIIK